MINPALLITLLAVSPALMAAPAERPCRDDVMKHCGDAVGDREQISQCMQKHFSKFSEQCRSAIAERRQGQGQGEGQGERQGQGGKHHSKQNSDS